MDNPIEFANIIINDIFADANMPVGILPQNENEIDFENEFYNDMDEISK